MNADPDPQPCLKECKKKRKKDCPSIRVAGAALFDWSRSRFLGSAPAPAPTPTPTGNILFLRDPNYEYKYDCDCDYDYDYDYDYD